MRYDVNEVWDQWQEQLFEDQEAFEDKAIELYKAGKQKELNTYLTNHTLYWGSKVVDKAWELGDLLWTKYDEKF
jgi:hypothetical protein